MPDIATLVCRCCFMSAMPRCTRSVFAGSVGMPRVLQVEGVGRIEVHHPTWEVPQSESPPTILDGDTVVFRGEHWRLCGFDAPESRLGRAKNVPRELAKDVEDRAGGWAHCEEELELGFMAAERLQEILEEAIPRNALTIQVLDQRLDAHQRRLVNFLVDGLNVGNLLQREGLAKPYGGTGPRPSHCSCKSHRQLREEAVVAADAAAFREQQRRFDNIARRA